MANCVSNSAFKQFDCQYDHSKKVDNICMDVLQTLQGQLRIKDARLNKSEIFNLAIFNLIIDTLSAHVFCCLLVIVICSHNLHRWGQRTFPLMHSNCCVRRLEATLKTNFCEGNQFTQLYQHYLSSSVYDF